MKKLLKYLKPYSRQIILASLLMTVSTCCNLLLPTIMSNILDKGVYQAGSGDAYAYILTNSGWMLLVAAVSLGAVIAGFWFSSKVVASFTKDLRSAIFQKVHHMTFEELGRIGTGALVTRSTHDVGTLSWVASMLTGSIVTVPILFIGGVVLSFTKDVLLSCIVLAFVPLIILAVILIGKKITPLWELSDSYIDKQNDIMRERIRGIRVIRAFNKEPHEHERIAEATQVMAKNIIKANVTMNIVMPMASFVLNVAVLLIVYVGGLRLQNRSSLTPGDIFAVIQYVTLVLNAVIFAGFAIIMFPHAKVAARRISEVTEAASTADTLPDEPELHFGGDIVFEDVSFQYEGADAAAVSHVNLHIHPGDKISVIGGTGSGKSTLVSLLLSFRVPTSGRILFDGRDAATISRKTIRRNISVSLQKAMIYSGTLRENVQMGELTADAERLDEAVKLAQLSDFVAEQEKGLDYELTQAGSNLSGGQKQRLAIARAVIKDAPIYIFDDSFSALDFLTEARLRTGLNEKFKGRTQIVITQRVTSAMNSDCIFVMDKGELVDAGRHTELLERCTIYREIYASQTGGSRK